MTIGKAITPYQALVTRVIDGDTIVCSLDLGFNVWVDSQHFRIYGCNAAERGTPAGDAAAANLRGLLPPGKSILLTSVKNDKFGGRYDAIISFSPTVGMAPEDLANYLVRNQWAAAWDGTGERPVPIWPRTVTP